jgi:hypothetical protein
MRINLKVPFAEKDQAKALGARWDPAKKTWYIVDKPDLSPFSAWMDLGAAEQKPVAPMPVAPVLDTTDYGDPPWEVTAHDIILK